MKRIIIILTSIILLILSFLSINKKIIQPTIANKNYEKESQKMTEELIHRIEEVDKQKEEQLKEIQETVYETIPLPKNEEEICKTVIGTYFNYINSRKYSEAYKMLDDKFKANYFDTYEKYEQYCLEKYADFKILEYIKYERRNDFIMVKINVINLRDRSVVEEMQINIAEKGNYTYKISFGIEG